MAEAVFKACVLDVNDGGANDISSQVLSFSPGFDVESVPSTPMNSATRMAIAGLDNPACAFRCKYDTAASPSAWTVLKTAQEARTLCTFKWTRDGGVSVGAANPRWELDGYVGNMSSGGASGDHDAFDVTVIPYDVNGWTGETS